MKSIIALGVGLVVALAPGGTALADAPVPTSTTGNGNAYGNCQHSSAVGSHAPLTGGAGKGNGGWVTTAKALQAASVVPAEGTCAKPDPVKNEDGDGTAPTPPATDGGENDETDSGNVN